MKLWVNIFTMPYKQNEFYVSKGYDTKTIALGKLKSPKAKAIVDRYQDTVKIEFKKKPIKK